MSSDNEWMWFWPPDVLLGATYAGTTPKMHSVQSLNASKTKEPRVAMVPPSQVETFDGSEIAKLYQSAFYVISERTLFSEADFAPFQSIKDLVFFGPFLAERDVAVGDVADGVSCALGTRGAS